MSTVADVVVAGAGHNSLVTAAYLARAGFEVVVLEERPVVGGNTATEELTLPGFLHDSCSTAHNLHPGEPCDQGAAARGGLRARVPPPRPGRARRLRGRGVDHAVARPRPDVRGARPLLGTRRRRLQAADRRLRRRQGRVRRVPQQPDRPGAAARRGARRHLEAAAGDERLGRHPRRVRGRALAGLHALDGVHDRAAVRPPGHRPARVLARLRPPAAQLDAPARRLGRAPARARAPDRGARRHASSRARGSAASSSRTERASASRPSPARPTGRRGRSSPPSTSSTSSRWRRGRPGARSSSTASTAGARESASSRRTTRRPRRRRSPPPTARSPRSPPASPRRSTGCCGSAPTSAAGSSPSTTRRCSSSAAASPTRRGPRQGSTRSR